MFSYLDGCDVYYAFSNLNNRFENLLKNSIVVLKIEFLHKINLMIKNRYEQFIHRNKYRIISLNFSDQFFLDQFIELCAINSSFILNEVSTFQFIILLFYFKSLPCLSSLTVNFGNFDDNLGQIYQLIFHLSLKYFKLRILDYQESYLNIPIATSEQTVFIYRIFSCWSFCLSQ
ncbi:hypothetical protein I4U23_024176 [Adineta vaga]|nr:hypothetical protein I4U23_024176 [Adineta vaga]